MTDAIEQRVKNVLSSHMERVSRKKFASIGDVDEAAADLLRVINDEVEKQTKSFSRQVIENAEPEVINLPAKTGDPSIDGKNEGIARADAHADESWKICYDKCLRIVCETMQEFCADDITEYMEQHYPNVTTHSKRAAGARMLCAARNGWCERTNRFVVSAQPTHHAQAKVLWLSKLYNRKNVGQYIT